MAISKEWENDIIVMVIVFVFLTASVLIPKYLKEKGKLTKFSARKIIHSLAGLTILSTPFLNYPFLAFIMAAIMTFITRKSSNESSSKPLKELFQAIGEEEELKYGYLQGPFAYSLAITILVFIFLFFSDKYYYPIVAVLIMMYSDTLASIIGKKYGNHLIRVPWTSNKRTLEGSSAFFVSAMFLSFITFYLIGMVFPYHSFTLNFTQIWVLSFLMSIISTILELCSPSKYDDLIVPIGVIIVVVPIAIGLNWW